MKGKRRATLRILFVIYIIVLLKVIVFKYPFSELMEITKTWQRGVILEGLETANFTLFKTIKMYIRYAGQLNSFENLVGNIVAFIPLGMFLPLLFPECRKFFIVLVDGAIIVLGIELFQLFSAFGAFDVDDILLNIVGILIGYICFSVAIYHVKHDKAHHETK